MNPELTRIAFHTLAVFLYIFLAPQAGDFGTVVFFAVWDWGRPCSWSCPVLSIAGVVLNQRKTVKQYNSQ
jgi:hypothetical protein